jgi:vacuolar-type H+-ATPase subunit H
MEDIEVIKKIKEAEDASVSELERMRKLYSEKVAELTAAHDSAIREQKERLEKEYSEFVEIENAKVEEKVRGILAEARKRAATLKLNFTRDQIMEIFDREIQKVLEESNGPKA